MSEDTQKKLEEARRGNEARRVLAEPIVEASVAALKDRYLEEWVRSAPGDTVARERLHLAYTMVDEVFAHLRVLEADGRVADSHILKLKKRD